MAGQVQMPRRRLRIWREPAGAITGLKRRAAEESAGPARVRSPEPTMRNKANLPEPEITASLFPKKVCRNCSALRPWKNKAKQTPFRSGVRAVPVLISASREENERLRLTETRPHRLIRAFSRAGGRRRTIGSVPEWLKGTGCKPVGVSLRWFESSPAHSSFRRCHPMTKGASLCLSLRQASSCSCTALCYPAWFPRRRKCHSQYGLRRNDHLDVTRFTRVWIETATKETPQTSASVSHSPRVISQMAEVAVPQTRFREVLARIRRLRFWTASARPGGCVVLLRTRFRNGGQRSRRATTVGKESVLDASASLVFCILVARHVEAAGIF